MYKKEILERARRRGITHLGIMRGFGSLAAPAPMGSGGSGPRKRGVVAVEADEVVAGAGSGGKRSRGFGSLAAPGGGAPASRGGQGFGSLSSSSLGSPSLLTVSVPAGKAPRLVRQGGAPGVAAPVPEAPVSAGRRAEGVRGRGTTAYNFAGETEAREVPPMPEERRTKLLKVCVPTDPAPQKTTRKKSAPPRNSLSWWIERSCEVE
jgi:hypothetical protein